MKSPAYVAGFVVGIVCVFIAFLVINLIAKKKNKRTKVAYDERQQAARGKAFEFGFLVYTFIEVALMLCYGCDIVLPLSEYTIHTFTFFISFIAFIIYCIWTDAYFQVGEAKKFWFIIITAAGILNLLIFILQRIRKSSSSYTNLVCAIMCIVVVGNVFAKILVDKRAEKKSEEE